MSAITSKQYKTHGTSKNIKKNLNFENLTADGVGSYIVWESNNIYRVKLKC